MGKYVHRAFPPCCGALLCLLGCAGPPADRRTEEPFTIVSRAVEEAIGSRAFPGCAVAVGRADGEILARGFGKTAYDETGRPVTEETIYDLASVTKVVGTTTAVIILCEEGRLSLDDPVARFIPEAAGTPKASITVRHLLTHTSGLPAYRTFFKEIKDYRRQRIDPGKGKKWILGRILEEPLEYPMGTRTIYSDLGVLLLGEIIERASGMPIEDLYEKRIFAPLGMDDTCFLPGDEPPPDAIGRIAPTEDDPEFGRITGAVHDENARAMGGIAAHAGLFSTASDLSRFARAFLRRARGLPPEGGSASPDPELPSVIRTETVRLFTRRQDLVRGSSRGLGWDTISRGSRMGSLFSPSAFGHTGFTGTSIWIDPEKDIYVVILANRVHPTRKNLRIGAARRAIHDAVMKAYGGPR